MKEKSNFLLAEFTVKQKDKKIICLTVNSGHVVIPKFVLQGFIKFRPYDILLHMYFG